MKRLRTNISIIKITCDFIFKFKCSLFIIKLFTKSKSCDALYIRMSQFSLPNNLAVVTHAWSKQKRTICIPEKNKRLSWGHAKQLLQNRAAKCCFLSFHKTMTKSIGETFSVSYHTYYCIILHDTTTDIQKGQTCFKWMSQVCLISFSFHSFFFFGKMYTYSTLTTQKKQESSYYYYNHFTCYISVSQASYLPTYTVSGNFLQYNNNNGQLCSLKKKLWLNDSRRKVLHCGGWVKSRELFLLQLANSIIQFFMA